MIIKISKGHYKLNNSLSASLPEDISFEEGYTYLLCGDNGTGKSSFLKSILVPEINKLLNSDILLFYTEQDMTLQFCIVKAYFEGLEKLKFESNKEILFFLKQRYLELKDSMNKKIVFILDEIDQYIDINTFVENFNIPDSTYIICSHNIHNIFLTHNVIKLNFSKRDNSLTEIKHEINI